MERRTYKLSLAYEGGAYHGWQRQAQDVTVQAEVEKVLARLTGREVRLTGAGRTDAGVHALGQVAGFSTDSKMEEAEFKRAMNALLPGDIRILEVRRVAEEFHARYDASSKQYRYHLWIGDEPPFFFRRWVWHLRRLPDEQLLKKSLALLCGRQDFAAFQSTGSETTTSTRNMSLAELETAGPLATFTFEANGFLRHMVRALVGTLIDHPDPKDIADILASKNRGRAGRTAPAQGLFMVQVRYPGQGEPIRAASPFEAI